jgi:two-component system nitrate/nitrite response regulator NarL
MTNMRVVLADNDPRVSSALHMLFGCEPELEIAGEATNTSSLVALSQDVAPDLILLDWELQGPPDAELLSKLRDVLPHTRIVALSGRPESAAAALEAGADAFVSKAEPAYVLMATVMELAASTRVSERAGRR